MIELMFTTSDFAFSRLARWATDSDCSHFAICFDRRVVFHSNFSGPHIEPIETFVKKNHVIHKLEFTTIPTLAQEDALWSNLININYGKSYDFGAMLFLGLNLIGHKLINIDISNKNLWKTKEGFICTELLESLSGLSFGSATFPDFKNIEMLRPHDLYLELSCLQFLTVSQPPVSYLPA
jgi:hypothetical protein